MMTNIEYHSVFQKELANLIETKQALGFKYETEAAAFRRIDDFFCENQLTEKVISKELTEKWCAKRSYESSQYHFSRVSLFRVFCEYVSDLGYSVFIPPKGMSKGPKYDAYIYTDDELKRFFKAVDNSKSVPSECPYRGLIMPVFFRILYTSGMRVSELRLAKVGDIDLENGCIRVCNGKNHKERYVPIHPDLVERCKEIKTTIHTNSSDDEFFFMLYPGREMTLGNVYHNFRRYLEKAGISHLGRGHGPRIHDFRHTYCVNLILRWIKEDKDILAYMPYMRTILGHETFNETAYYIKMVTAAFPVIREKLDKAFPNIVEEVVFDDREFH